jgi:hypothetical protein
LEENLVVFEEPSLKQQCYCSVMGSLGEMRMHLSPELTQIVKTLFAVR